MEERGKNFKFYFTYSGYSSDDYEVEDDKDDDNNDNNSDDDDDTAGNDDILGDLSFEKLSLGPNDNNDKDDDNNDNNSDDDDDTAGNDDILGDLSFEKLSLGPKKKLLILSLNGLLIHRVFRFNYIPDHRRPPDGTYGNQLVFKRPFVDDFLRFCFDRFEIGIWSSAMEHNIDGVLYCVMKGFQGKLLFVWDQHECTDTGFKSLEKKQKPLFLKELKNIWEDDDNKLPFQNGQYSSKNTLMIDDNPYKALLNPLNTSIFPEAYDPKDEDDDALDPKGDLCQFLNGLAEAEDVQAFVEEHPFGQPAVTPMHPDWAFYSRVLHRLSKQ